MSYPILNLAKLTISIAALSLCATSSFAMTALDDAELSEKSGQALLNLSTIMPGEQGNVNGNTGFYKVGLQAQLDLNANIRKLQLGCGGINGADGCDVDIDYLRFAGLGSLDANGRPINDGGPATDFNLVNPYVEFAFSDPDSLVNRKLVGLRIGSEQTRGVLSIGTRPVDAQGNAVSSEVTVDGVPQEDVSKHTGINSLSGVIGELLVVGTADTNLGPGDIQGRDDDDNDSLATFDNVYSSRASELRLAPLEVNNVLGFVNVDADLITSLKLIHNLKIANNGDFGMFVERALNFGGEHIAIHSHGRPGRHTGFLASTHHKAVELAHLVMQQADGILRIVVGTEAVRTDQFGEPVGLVRGGGVPATAHFGQSHAEAALRELPRRLAPRETAADDVDIMGGVFVHAMHLVLVTHDPQALAGRGGRPA